MKTLGLPELVCMFVAVLMIWSLFRPDRRS